MESTAPILEEPLESALAADVDLASMGTATLATAACKETSGALAAEGTLATTEPGPVGAGPGQGRPCPDNRRGEAHSGPGNAVGLSLWQRLIQDWIGHVRACNKDGQFDSFDVCLA